MLNLTQNTSLSTTLLYTIKPLNEKPLLVQFVVGTLLSVNGLMIFTFLKKEIFWEETRYVLFAQTLFVDSANMMLTYLGLMGTFYQYAIHIIPCSIAATLISLFSICTPVTLVSMCLERYVAICMPLRHGSISTPKNTCIGILIIWAISLIIPSFVLTVFWVYGAGMRAYVLCSVEVLLQVNWLIDTRAASLQTLFILMFSIIVSTYIKIMIAARSASGDNKKSTHKGLRTVILHGVQLFLCVLRFLIPYIEMPLWKVDAVLLMNVRYTNYILFVISPCCLSPLIYGLRDKKFCNALKYYAFCVNDCSLRKISDVKPDM